MPREKTECAKVFAVETTALRGKPVTTRAFLTTEHIINYEPTDDRTRTSLGDSTMQGFGPHVVEAQPPARFAGGENREIAPATLGKSPERRAAPHARNCKGENPAAPIRFPNGPHSHDSVASLIKKPRISWNISFDFRMGVAAVPRFANI